MMAEAASPYFIPAGSGSARTIAPGFDLCATAGDRMTLSVVRLAEGAVVPSHAHPHEQMGFLVSGRLRFTIGAETRDLYPGDIWRIPGGVTHSAVAVDGPVVALDAFHPVREDYR